MASCYEDSKVRNWSELTGLSTMSQFVANNKRGESIRRSMTAVVATLGSKGVREREGKRCD